MPNKKIQIYTDGSCIGNPGPGGWGVLILGNPDSQENQSNVTPVELSGSEPDTTNNRMEMMAIIQALKYLHKKHKKDIQSLQIEVCSDSNLIIQTLNQGWKRKANTDLWAEIDRLRAWLNITWTWVKAHADNPHNNHVDQLAFKAAKSISLSDSL